MKKITFILFMGILLTSCVGNNLDKEQENYQKILENKELNIQNTNKIEENKNDNLVNVEKASGLIQDLEDFNNIYKKVLLSTGKGNKTSEEEIKITLSQWNKIESNYLGKNVEGFKNTQHLDSKLSNIGINIRNADSLVSKGDLKEAHEELEYVRKKLKLIREENGIKNISDDMLIVHDIMEEIVEHYEEKNIIKFDEIKVGISALKTYYLDNEDYNIMIGSFENILNGLLESNGDEYKNKLKELKPVFIKMYMKFG